MTQQHWDASYKRLGGEFSKSGSNGNKSQFGPYDCRSGSTILWGKTSLILMSSAPVCALCGMRHYD